MRSFIVYLTIAALQLCPYNCAVEWNATHGALDGGGRACCAQCLAREDSNVAFPGHDQSAQHPAPDKHPAPDQDGRSCLCEGAVFAAAAQGCYATSLQDFLWIGMTDPAERQGLASLTATATCGSISPPQAGGLAARIALCSLVL